MSYRTKFFLLRRRIAGHEHRFLVERHISDALRFYRHNTISERMRNTVAAALATGEPLSEKGLSTAIERAQAHTPFAHSEFVQIKPLVALLMLDALHHDYNRDLLERYLTDLRFLDKLDFAAFLEKHSLLEQRLAENTAGVYSASTEQTKQLYRDAVSSYAKEKRISELSAADRLRSRVSPLCTHPKAGVVSLALLWTLSILISVVVGFLTESAILAILLFLPISSLCKQVIDDLFARLFPASPLPRLALEQIPPQAKTLVVITTLLTGEESDLTMVRRLEHFYLANKDAHIRFGLLCDLPDAASEHTDADAKMVAPVRSAIAKLNEKYGDHFAFFLRHRTYATTEHCFLGWERKRGAILELVRLIYGKATSFYLTDCDASFLRETAYLLTLDADTDLGLNNVNEMVGTALHPANRPVIADGRVVRGYGVLQPRMAVSPCAASKTKFSMVTSHGGGRDTYAFAAYDNWQTLFGEGSFCGKGLLDVRCYDQLLDTAFPEGQILSHDLLEGGILRCGLLSDLVLTDGTPRHALSWFRRLHRWIRGDLQAALFGGKQICNAVGERIKTPLSPITRYKLFENLRRIFVPVASILALVYGAISGHTRSMCALFFVLAPLAYPVLRTLLLAPRFMGRRFFSAVVPAFGQALRTLFFEICTLFYTAQITMDAVLRSLYRRWISGSKLLEWTTADAADKQGGNLLVRILYQGIPSALVGSVFMIFVPYGGYRLLGFAFFSLPFFFYHTSKVRICNIGISSGNKDVIRKYALNEWSFYKRFVTAEEHDLPPDNYQDAPHKRIAHRTSPTNIGLYLLSVLCAHDLNFINTKELLRRVDSTLTTIEALPTWKGHLYNWYDTRTLEVLGAPYVSTVDSGNFVTALIPLRQGLLALSKEEKEAQLLADRVERMINGADFSALYLPKRHLFSIGFHTEENKADNHCYDLLMSECRTTSFFAIATGQVPKSHWSALGRPLVQKNGRIGLAAWTGTMFEYLMPTLLLPTFENTLLHESVQFAVYCQQITRAHGLWGQSESGYFYFDADRNYQYRAFGVQALGIKSGLGADSVLAPYATFLTLPFHPHSAIENLRRMEQIGMVGEHGFYEAIDFTPSRVGRGHAIVRSYMAHHVGMSILAATNALRNNILCRRFFADPRMASAKELLEERIPTDAPIYPHFSFGTPAKFPSDRTADLHTSADTEVGRFALLSNGSARIVASASYGMTLWQDTTLLCRSGLDTGDLRHGLHVYFSVDGKPFSACTAPPKRDGSSLVYAENHGTVRTNLCVSMHGEHSVFLFSFSAEGAFLEICPMLVFTPVLTEERAYLAHPAFHGLSLSAEFDVNTGILYYRRRSRTGGAEQWLAVTMRGAGEDLSFSTRRDLLPLCYTAEDLKALCNREFPNEVGACIDPFCAVKKTSKTENGRYFCDFLLAFGQTKAEAGGHILALRNLRHKALYRQLHASMRNVDRSLCASAKLEPELSRFLVPNLTALFTAPNPRNDLRAPSTKNDLWQYGISGDLPILTFSVQNDPRKSYSTAWILKGFLAAHRYLLLAGISFDLVLLCGDASTYGSPIRSGVQELLIDRDEELLLGRSGGIFLLDESAAERVRSDAVFYAEIDAQTLLDPLLHQMLVTPPHAPQPHTKPEKVWSHPPTMSEKDVYTVWGGAFLSDRFVIYKGVQNAPWSYVYAGSSFGTLVTQNSLGFTFGENAQRMRLTKWNNDQRTDLDSERLILVMNDAEYDLCACADRVSYFHGFARWEGSILGKHYTVEAGIDADRSVKLITIQGDLPFASLSLAVKPDMGHTMQAVTEGALTCRRDFCHESLATTVVYTHRRDTEAGVLFLIGMYQNDAPARLHQVLARYQSIADAEAAFARYASTAEKLLCKYTLKSNAPLLDAMFNYYLPYQALYVRLMARTGFYQNGGAFGFRDQLQDALCALPLDPTITHKQILRAAAHQYVQGDVMHWWHQVPKTEGVRTRCSDDLLWLPFAVSIAWAQEDLTELLNTQIPFLDSQPLLQNEQDRYECPAVTTETASLYDHCIRAIDHAYRLGVHRLPLIGSGDWNDGLSHIGRMGLGESVWLGLFLLLVLRRFLPICEVHGTEAEVSRLQGYASQLHGAIRRYGTENGRFLRGYTDRGIPFGGEMDDDRLFLLPQAFSVLALGKDETTVSAMKLAWLRLYDEDNHLLALFSPPYDKTDIFPGYISGYVPGVRENGGQYTHGAMFALWSLFAADLHKEAFTLLRALNPAERCSDAEAASRYRLEPYALAGDIYTAPAHCGRGGWSQYTGAAGWYWRILLAEVLGFRETADGFTLDPRLNEAFDRFVLTIDRAETHYTIETCLGKEPSATLDGAPAPARFLFDKKTHFVKIIVEKNGDIV